MKKSRTIYFLLFSTTIVLGLLSRHIPGVPLFIGDILWATMVYFMVRFLFINRTIKWVTIASVLFCYAIEFSQLYKAPWLDKLRHTVLGGLILGETFLWGDMLCYTAGIMIGIFIELLFRNNQKTNK